MGKITYIRNLRKSSARYVKFQVSARTIWGRSMKLFPSSDIWSSNKKQDKKMFGMRESCPHSNYTRNIVEKEKKSEYKHARYRQGSWASYAALWLIWPLAEPFSKIDSSVWSWNTTRYSKIAAVYGVVAVASSSSQSNASNSGHTNSRLHYFRIKTFRKIIWEFYRWHNLVDLTSIQESITMQ